MEVVLQQGHICPCRASSREGECESGLGVSACKGLQRLDDSKGHLPAVRGRAWAIYNRPVSIPNECTTSNVLQLETRSTCIGCGCSVHSMAETPALHVPSICVDKSVPGQDQGGGGRCTDDSPRMAEPGVVSNPTTDASELSSSPTRDSGHTDQPKRRAPPNGHGRTSPPSRLAHIRESYRSRGLSEGVIKMLSRSWRSTTESAYASAWRQWSSWCAERSLHPISAPVSDILDFLLVQFDAGKQYHTINTVRSAISMTHIEVDEVQVGHHPLVTRFLKGVFNSRPPGLCCGVHKQC